MYPNLRYLTLLSIFSLTLLSLTGCGEKRVHVATISGAPGDELILDPLTGNVEAQSTSGLNDASIDESALLSQTTDGKENFAEPTNQNETSDTNSPFASLSEGQDFSTQSNSSSGEQLNSSLAHNKDVQEPTPAQDFFTGLNDTLSGDGMEPVPDTFQIAKAEPSDSLQNQLNQIKNEELATAAAGLEDVYFQFDSWTLTQEGKQSLQRTLGWFEQAPSSNLIIEGHADQRGTQAYNMVLAKKRAVSVQDYLSQLGVPTSRLAVISYGKDKPFCQDVTEVCHQLNRRGHLLVPIQ
jgi:outer membrane protein OmpA-like peptidoglycan-associated protein